MTVHLPCWVRPAVRLFGLSVLAAELAMAGQRQAQAEPSASDECALQSQRVRSAAARTARSGETSDYLREVALLAAIADRASESRGSAAEGLDECRAHLVDEVSSVREIRRKRGVCCRACPHASSIHLPAAPCAPRLQDAADSSPTEANGLAYADLLWMM